MVAIIIRIIIIIIIHNRFAWLRSLKSSASGPRTWSTLIKVVSVYEVPPLVLCIDESVIRVRSIFGAKHTVERVIFAG